MGYNHPNSCILCNRILDEPSKTECTTHYFNCKRCGYFGIDSHILTNELLDETGKIISYALLKHPNSSLVREVGMTPVVFYEDIQKYISTNLEPNALELFDNFLAYYCVAKNIGRYFRDINSLELTLSTQARNFDAAKWALEQANAMGWLGSFESHTLFGAYSAAFEISVKGWQEFYERQKNDTLSQQAFFALQFNNKTLKNIIAPAIKLACEEAGFQLLAVDENRRAGLIDDKIRVDIRNSRFIVVDISDQNRGAHFEAGFAEGLGKPIFYICDKVVFDKHMKGHKTIHFDVEHHDIIVWDKDNPKMVGEDLLASIRNTLPNDAIMSDT